ncbi:hypothetical protein Pint_17731 [Pistacia integerrima]|uniref:Uncharacterized protein n=1 Tax=Pistacia integerrima TaxID=434235 RepID=A0ACC0YZI3_9ROSI|nr:hypothetical protein Pint_17731 [Pistacia integerrima]
MASIPHFFPDYSFSSGFSQFSYPVIAADHQNYGDHASASSGTISSGAISSCAASSGGAIWGDDQTFPISFDNVLPPESDVASPAPTMLFPHEQFGLQDTSAVPTLPDYNMSVCGISGIQNFGTRIQLPDVCEFGDECCGYMQDFKPPYPTAAENWGIQSTRMPVMEEANIKVGRYSVEERKDRILRYLKKKNQRNFNKTIKYACRKTLADRRVRVRGRFARNSELCEEENIKNNENNSHKEKDLFCNSDAIHEIKQDDESWLQEAMASLMYLPYIAGN